MKKLKNCLCIIEKNNINFEINDIIGIKLNEKRTKEYNSFTEVVEEKYKQLIKPITIEYEYIEEHFFKIQEYDPDFSYCILNEKVTGNFYHIMPVFLDKNCVIKHEIINKNVIIHDNVTITNSIIESSFLL